MGCSTCLHLLLVEVELRVPGEQTFPEVPQGDEILGKALFCVIKALSFQGPMSLHPAVKKSHFVLSRTRIAAIAHFLLHICTVLPVSGCVSLSSQLQPIVCGGWIVG